MAKQLSAGLEKRINQMVKGGADRSDLIARISNGAGINEDTVNAIIRGTIEHPPNNRLGAFSRVLGVSVAQLQMLRDVDKKSYRLPEWKKILGS